MKIPTAQQLHELDEQAVRQENITSAQLMERAAASVARKIAGRWGRDTSVVVFAGPGNNGGDALAVARMLHEDGYRVDTYLINPAGKLSPDCRTNRERLQAVDGASLTEVQSQFEAPKLAPGTLVVDGLFGTGLKRPLTGGFASLVKFINSSPARVVSIDMPSGLMCEDNALNVRSHVVHADLTLTFHRPKLAMFMADNQTCVGEVEVLDIGLSEEATESMDTLCELTERADVCRMLRPRDAFGHKGTFGHALLVAGSYGMAGAAVLAARACLRSGAGKVTVRTPLRNNDILQTAVPEAVLLHDKNPERFTTPVDAAPFDALAIGPGIGTHSDTALAFIEQVRRTNVPLLIDADGLNILGGHKGWLHQIPKDCVLTPHPAEFGRIGGQGADCHATLQEAVAMARSHKFYILLKGHFTAVCTPEGRVYFNPTGNSGMATAGSGDVLTGVIAALLAGKYPILSACRLGTYLHGLAGDMAAADLGEESVTASDLVRYLPAAFRRLWEERERTSQPGPPRRRAFRPLGDEEGTQAP